MEILSFEKSDPREDPRAGELRRELKELGVDWMAKRYHRRPTLPATAWDIGIGRRHVAQWSAGVRRSGRGGVVHARGYLPGLMGLAGRGGRVRLLFDMRGFWVDERIHGGYWAEGSIQARIGRWIERRVLGAADHLVVLTRRSTERLAHLARGPVPPWTVIPTCVDLDRFLPPRDRAGARARLGLGDGPILLHVGTLTGWYDAPGTLGVARGFVEGTGGRFVVLSRDEDAVRSLVAGAGLEPLVRFVPPRDVPLWMQAADAGLALTRPSVSEDARFPTKIGEYLACGLAVVAAPIGDLPEFEDPDCFRIMGSEDDVPSTVDWLVRVVADGARPGAARSLAESRLGVADGVERLAEIYRALGVVPGEERR